MTRFFSKQKNEFCGGASFFKEDGRIPLGAQPLSRPRLIFMRGISSTNLVNKEVSVQAKLKIDLSKLRY